MEKYTTLDAYQAGWLALNGWKPELTKYKEKVVFSFDLSDDLLKMIDAYNDGAQVGALQFALAVKRLKSQIFSLKSGNGDRSHNTIDHDFKPKFGTKK